MGARVSLDHVTIGYGAGDSAITVVNDLSLHVDPGGSIALLGPSGSGKSSVLNVVSGIIRPKSGMVTVDETRIDLLTVSGACDFRRSCIGFVFQAFHLLPHLDALENAAIGALVQGVSRHTAKVRAVAALSEVGLGHRTKHRPAELSGGEQQRVALARVLAAQPSLVLADEPTGNLDPAATELVIELLLRLRTLTGATVLVATHSPLVASSCDAAIALESAATQSRVVSAAGALLPAS